MSDPKPRLTGADLNEMTVAKVHKCVTVRGLIDILVEAGADRDEAALAARHHWAWAHRVNTEAMR